MYTLMKTAGMVLDHQDDPGSIWETEIQHFWPSDLPEPTVGIDKHASCIAEFSDGMQKWARYPVDTPEDTLASAMYFLSYGRHEIEDGVDKIAQELDDYLILHDVRIPQEFITYIHEKVAGLEEVEEVYADDGNNLPITTPHQTLQSIDFFFKNASHWNAEERFDIVYQLKEASDHHEIDADMPYVLDDMVLSDKASDWIGIRKNAMLQYRSNAVQNYGDSLDTQPFDNYIEAMDRLLEEDDVCKVASQLEYWDRELAMDHSWDREFPNAFDSVVDIEVQKTASYDLGGLRGTFEDHVVDAIESDPDTIIPTLPIEQRQIVEDYLHEHQDQ